ncbi:MAG: hypothetical protein K2Y25_05900 [Pseudomonadaceae bacterium]|nr:hypothetical protein [Pseudomonadaceae bacterium]
MKMGQAKNRGSLSDRVALAQKKSIELTEPHELYRIQMVEVKRRFRVAAKILDSKEPLTGDVDIDNECVFMQVRRIIELITFSAIASDQQRYQRKRELEAERDTRDNGDYTTDWNAPQILKRLNKISHLFLPRALGQMTVQPDGTKHFDHALTGLTTHSRLIEIYQSANGYAHTPNPFKENQIETDKDKRATARLTLQKDLAWLRAVIWNHAKFGLSWKPEDDPTQPAESETAWLIHLEDESTDQVTMALATAT